MPHHKDQRNAQFDGDIFDTAENCAIDDLPSRADDKEADDKDIAIFDAAVLEILAFINATRRANSLLRDKARRIQRRRTTASPAIRPGCANSLRLQSAPSAGEVLEG